MRSILLRCKHTPHLSRGYPSCSPFHSFTAATCRTSAVAEGAEAVFTLEASVGAANPIDIELISTGAFRAEVHPELPIATTWQGLYKQLSNRVQARARKQAQEAAAAAQAVHNAAIVSEIIVAEQAIAAAGVKPVLHVATVGAQLNSMAQILDTMCAAAGVTAAGDTVPQPEHKPHADALLLVSGSHPFRQLPLLRQVLPSSVKMLQHASKLKQQHILPQQLSLWAVANPVTEKDASYTESKVAAGAEVILTQPPLDWDAFQSWMDDAQRRGLHTAARLLVGFPLLSSAGNVAFWAALCQAQGRQQVQQLQQQFIYSEQQLTMSSSSSASAKLPGMTPFAEEWNRQLLSKLQATPGIGGLHVMAITANSKRLALRMAREGAFAPTAWPLAAVATSSSTTASDRGGTGGKEVLS